MFNIKLEGKEMYIEEGLTLKDLAEKVKDNYEHEIILALEGNELRELGRQIKKNSSIRFITLGSSIGNDCYRRSVIFMMLAAVNELYGSKEAGKLMVEYSVDNGIYCRRTNCDNNIDIEEFCRLVKEKMIVMNENDVRIKKSTISLSKAEELFLKKEMPDKAKTIKYRRSSTVSIYTLGDYQDYFYGYMAYSTGILKWFDIFPYEGGFIVAMPKRQSPYEISEFNPKKKVFDVFAEAEKWVNTLGVSTLGAINEKIIHGDIEDVILVQEALQEKKIAMIADEIASRKNAKIVLIAGPSSSGKTSFSHRLSIQLKAQGLNPHPIPVDNYFVNRENTPLDEEGKMDYEALEAVDIRFFNDQMVSLLAGEEVELPEFDFINGKRMFKGNRLKLKEDDILVIEGIHCLNDNLTISLPEESKFRIYVSALTPLNADEHNRIATSDLRLIRRMVRDVRTRGHSAKATIEMWKRVRRGEEKNIFPYQEMADVVFNSSLVYELAVLKTYAEPALFCVPSDCEEYLEAKRLLKFLDYVIPTPNDKVPNNSLLREFSGGSIFKV